MILAIHYAPLTEVVVNAIPSGLNAISDRNNVWATKSKTSGNKPKGIGNNDHSYVSQIFFPKTCGFIYVIVP